MNPTVQLVVVLMIVAVAAAVIVRRFARAMSGKPSGGCGASCGGCSSKAPLVTLGMPPAASPAGLNGSAASGSGADDCGDRASRAESAASRVG